MQKTTITSIICFFLLLPVLTKAQEQNWQEILESNFDIAESFDQLEDWSGTLFGDVYNQSDMPLMLDESPSRWGYYSYWASYPSIQNWIGYHGVDNTWRGGGKSLCVDISTEANNQGGPSRLGTYFGDGTPTSGYSDLYLFYMTKISPNQWPTSIIGGVGEYSSSATQYAYFESWKFGTFNLGCVSVDCDENGGAAYSPYYLVIPHIKTISATNFIPTLRMEPAYSGDTLGLWGNASFAYYGQWAGVEFHLRNANENGNLYTYMDVWQYDSQGNSTQVISNYKYQYDIQLEAYKWNSFFFGGNNSNTYSWGESMQGPYYVDDLIIDDQRIGPTYFSLLDNQSILETCTDGVQNQDETGIDCGGSCDACIIPTTYGLSNFISAITNWLGIGDSNSDVNSDGIVNTRDLGVMMSGWSQ